MVRSFDDNPTQATRALQIWQILIGKAHNRQTITYGQLAELLGFGGAGTLAQLLGPVLHYCRQQELPPLTVLVVSKDSGLPGDGVKDIDLNSTREEVFRFNWYGIWPPTTDELNAALPSS